MRTTCRFLVEQFQERKVPGTFGENAAKVKQQAAANERFNELITNTQVLNVN